MSGERVAPNFFILGAPKCATTTLYDALSRHPDICMSREKEPRFFELDYRHGIEHYESTAFAGCRAEAAVGEASPLYLVLPYVAARIHCHYPTARLVAVLREPLDRAHSAWWMHFSAGREDMSFADALEENLARRRAGVSFEGLAGEYLWRRNVEAIEERGLMLFRTYVDAGLYGDALARYRSKFSQRQVRVVFFEDLVQDPEKVLAEVLDFLGVEHAENLVLPHSNAAIGQRWTPLVRLLSPLTRKGLVPRALIDAGKAALGGSRPPPPELPPPVRSELEGLFGADLRLLREMIPGLSLPESWRIR